MDNLLNIMKALSDENRLTIIELLMKYDFCVGALSRKLEISEAAVSQHLKILRNAGIVTGEKRGYYTHYDVNRQLIEAAGQALCAMAEKKESRKGCRQHLTGNHQYCSNKLPASAKKEPLTSSPE